MQSFSDPLDREHSHERVPAKAIDGTGAAQVPVELSPIQEVGEGQLREAGEPR